MPGAAKPFIVQVTPNRSAVAIACALITTWFTAACGGSDGPTPPAEPKITSLQVVRSVQPLVVGETDSVRVQALDQNGTVRPATVTWTSSATDVVQVNGSGAAATIAAVSAGQATLTARTGDVSTTIGVSVLAEQYSDLEIVGVLPTLYTGRVATVTVHAKNRRGAEVELTDATLTSSNPAVLAVDAGSVAALTPGSATLTASATGASASLAVTVKPPPLAIELVYPLGVAAATRQAAEAAAVRWENVFAEGWAAQTVSVEADRCGPGTPAVANETISGLRIYVFDHETDYLPAGAPGIGGPCIVAGGKVVTGRVYIAPASVTTLASDSVRFRNLVEHEIAHALGFGTLWAAPMFDAAALMFRGTVATQQYRAAGGTADGGVPLQDATHWSNSGLPGELMNTLGTTLSGVTLGALIDLGYPMRLEAADPFSVSSGASGQLNPGSWVGRDVALPPVVVVTR